jgi:hypothetical protein
MCERHVIFHRVAHSVTMECDALTSLRPETIDADHSGLIEWRRCIIEPLALW